MFEFQTDRFPEGSWPIRTEVGLVDFVDGKAKVSDPATREALLALPASFRVTEIGQPDSDPPGGPEKAETPSPAPELSFTAKVRLWAKETGKPYPKKGRLPMRLISEYRLAHDQDPTI